MAFCTGCSLLCDDIEVDFEGAKVKRTMNLCRKGRAHYDSLVVDRLAPAVDGTSATIDEAISKAGELLAGSEKPLLFGWGNSTLAAQRSGIELAKKLGSVIDDPSSYSQGIITEKILAGEPPAPSTTSGTSPTSPSSGGTTPPAAILATYPGSLTFPGARRGRGGTRRTGRRSSSTSESRRRLRSPPTASSGSRREATPSLSRL